MSQHWHNCSRWERRKIPCPFLALEEEDEDEDTEEREREPVRDPSKKEVSEEEDEGAVDRVVVPRLIRPKREKTKGDADKLDPPLPPSPEVDAVIPERFPDPAEIEKEAEEVIRPVPQPIPKVLEPVGILDPMLRDRARVRAARPIAAARGAPALAPVAKRSARLDPGVVAKGRRATVGIAAAIAMKELSGMLPDPTDQHGLEMAEEAIVQEFVKAPKPKKAKAARREPGFKLTPQAIGAGAAGAAAIHGVIQAGRSGGSSGSMVFNASQRMAEMMGQ